MKCVRFEDLRTGNKRIGFIDGDVSVAYMVLWKHIGR